jgi:hypothetical protein
MQSPYFFDFYNNWTQKANEIVGDSLSHVYDKYITLFITFNNLYNRIPQELINRGITMPDKIYDNKAATDYVVKYLGATNILTELTNSNNDKNIDALISIIDQELFYIKLKHGQRQRVEDLKILDNLRSRNNVYKATAVLQVVYYVRCNMFHGHKQFIQYQRLLVEPLINILSTINRRLFSKLTE